MRTGAVTAVAVVVLIAFTVPAVGGPGDGWAPVREQNVDANGAIRVAQQGNTQVAGMADLAAKINQLNAQVASLTEVTKNIRDSAAMLASPPPAKVIRLLLVDDDGRDAQDFPPMLVSSLTVEGGTDEGVVWVSEDPISANHSPTFTFGSSDDSIGFRHLTFPQPVLLRSSRVFCANEIDPCQIDVTLVGTFLP